MEAKKDIKKMMQEAEKYKTDGEALNKVEAKKDIEKMMKKLKRVQN